jgi:hypothetical protein
VAKKWRVNLENGYMGIVSADTKAQAHAAARTSVRGRFGEPAEHYDPEITSIQPATDEDIAWFVGMGGSLD